MTWGIWVILLLLVLWTFRIFRIFKNFRIFSVFRIFRTYWTFMNFKCFGPFRIFVSSGISDHMDLSGCQNFQLSFSAVTSDLREFQDFQDTKLTNRARSEMNICKFDYLLVFISSTIMLVSSVFFLCIKWVHEYISNRIWAKVYENIFSLSRASEMNEFIE